MRHDLDRLMAERNLDAFIIPGGEGIDPFRDYITGGVGASALVVKKRDEAPVLIVNIMETDEAAKSGLRVMTYDDFDDMGIQKKHGRGTAEAKAALWTRIFDELGISGRITLYGVDNIQSALGLFEVISNHLNERVTLVKDQTPDIFAVASETKDPDELEKLRESGIRASAVMRDTRNWLSTHRDVNGQIVNSEGVPLTIGAVKRYVRFNLMEHDLEDGAHGMIFAQGRDAGVPHSRGEDSEILRAGESIVFDLFPRPIGGGYHHDMTRTWCLGHAREDVQQAYDTVLEVFWRCMEGLTVGGAVKELGRLTCEWFEAAGHPTRLNTPTTTEGYIHALAHGIGLNIHETPVASHLAADGMVFKAGNVITVEPGLYYPSRGFGIRIEDTVYLDESGNPVTLTDCPYDLVVPLNG